MDVALQGNRKLLGTLVIGLLLESLVAYGGASALVIPGGDPGTALEVVSVTVQNTGGRENLQHYPVAVSLDETTFDFSLPSKDGSDLAVWDATSREPISDWLESYDPASRKGLLWVRLPALGPQASRRLLLTVGRLVGCAATAFNGYSVFPFFSDVNDVLGWQATNRLSVTNTIVEGPLTISNRSVIESDGMYNGFPAVVEAANGDFVLSYKKGPGHVNSPLVVMRRSPDAGATWSPEVVYFDSSQPDPALLRTPLGNLIIALGKLDQHGVGTGAYSRSVDNGLTWGPFTSFEYPPTDTLGVAPLLVVGQTMYGTGYGPYQSGMGFAPSLWSSADDGVTWAKLSGASRTGRSRAQ